jgi:hypothetical protein
MMMMMLRGLEIGLGSADIAGRGLGRCCSSAFCIFCVDTRAVRRLDVGLVGLFIPVGTLEGMPYLFVSDKILLAFESRCCYRC